MGQRTEIVCGLRIRDWGRKFESSKSESVKNTQWVLLPNKTTGKGFRKIRKERDWLEIYSVFVLMAAWCSQKPPPRQGCLTEDGSEESEPLDLSDMSLILNIPLKKVKRAVEVLSRPEIAWLIPIDGGTGFTNSEINSEDSVKPQRGRNGAATGPLRDPSRAREIERERDRQKKREGDGDAKWSHPAVKQWRDSRGKWPSEADAKRIISCMPDRKAYDAERWAQAMDGAKSVEESLDRYAGIG